METKAQSIPLCNVCRDVIVRENVPWNREWRCKGEQHRRCTMIGCVPQIARQEAP